MRFCGQCGTPLKQMCPECGFANPLDYRFCGMCGIALSPDVDYPPAIPLSRPKTILETSRQQPALKSPIVPPAELVVQPLEGERRTATVILADLTRSTDLLEQIGSEAWVELMNHIFQLLEMEIYRFGGQVDQFRGDGLVAFFGATSAHEDDSERAVLAGLAMQDVIKPYAAELAEEHKVALQLRVGVNTGEVIVTNIGDRRKYSEDTAMGEAVALAARMESSAESGTVLVSDNTYQLVQSLFEWQPLGEISVKGISQPVAVYRPLAPKPGIKILQHLQAYGLTAPLIGRDHEFVVLEGQITELETGQGSIVILTGDRGIGKSHLVDEVCQHVFRTNVLMAEVHDHENERTSGLPQALVWLQGHSRSYNQSWPYSLWLGLIHDWLGISDCESETETRQRLQDEARLLWGDQLDNHYPYLAKFLSLPLETQYAGRIKHLDADGLRQQFQRVIKCWVETMARRGPLVLSLSGFHWADASSLDLLEYCLPLTDTETLMWLIVLRPDRTSTAWDFYRRIEAEYPHRLTVLNLPPLTPEQSGEMIDALIGPVALPKETRSLVIHKAEGNPYFIEELILALIRQGALVQDSRTGKWQASRAVVSLDLPDTLQSLLLSRIDGLAVEERRVLQMAAVIGSVFWSNVLRALVGDEDQLNKSLATLQRAQLIAAQGRVPELGMEYVFKSNLILEVAYDNMLSTQRARYHRQVAEYLELHFGETVSPHYYGMLAHHYHRAEEKEKELFYTQLAAREAEDVYANAEALALYTRALELLDELETKASDADRLHSLWAQRFEVLNERRELRLGAIGDFEGARADAQALLPLARQLDDDPAWLIDALLQQPGVARWLTAEELEASLPMAEEALTLARQIGDRRREMQSLIAIASQRLELGDETAFTFAEAALTIARELDDLYYQAYILISMSRIFSWSNQPERGMAYLSAALPIVQKLDDKIAEIQLLGQIALQFERLGDYHRVLTKYHQPRLEISRQINHRSLEAEALHNLGLVRGIYLGDYEGGLALLEEAMANTSNIKLSLLHISQLHTLHANYEAALDRLERARQMRRQAADERDTAAPYLTAAILYNALNDEAHLYLSLESSDKLQKLLAEKPFITRQYEMAAACKAAAAHLRLIDRTTDVSEREVHRQKALESSQTALDIYEKLGYTQIIECVSEEIYYRHSQALAANNQPTQAAAYFQHAYDEMMRKYNLIPPDSPFRITFLENIPLHRDIRTAYTQLDSWSSH